MALTQADLIERLVRLIIEHDQFVMTALQDGVSIQEYARKSGEFISNIEEIKKLLEREHV